MEIRRDPEIPLQILHHEEHLAFPGYNAMVGERCMGQDEEDERKPWAVANVEAKEHSDGHGRDSVRMALYRRHRVQLLIAAIIWCAVPFLTPFLHATIDYFSLYSVVVALASTGIVLTWLAHIKPPPCAHWLDCLHLRKALGRKP